MGLVTIRPVFLIRMFMRFEQKVADFIKANNLFGSAERVLLAVSGGADSTALLYAMYALRAENVLKFDMLCAHINHQLRGHEADNDECFVSEQAAELNIPVITKRVDVRGFARHNKLSIETAARQLRIECLIDIARTNGCKLIATAHQKNDNAETILHRLARGTGFRGLAGIWPMRTFGDGFNFVRPLLCVNRDEIIEYLSDRKLMWRTDHTNEDCTFRRNYIRHRLLPALQEDCPCELSGQLSKLSQAARRFYEKVCSCADGVWPTVANRGTDETMILDLGIFQKQPQPVQVELIRRCLDSISCGQGNLTQGHFKRILHLVGVNVTGKKNELPDGFVVYREYENLIFCRVGLAPPSSPKALPVTVEIPGQTQFGQYLIEATVLDCKFLAPSFTGGSAPRRVERFDLDKIKLPLIVRHRQAGDKFIPLGMGGEKKVGKFLTAARPPQEVRANVLIVADAEKIIWVWPVRISEEAKITDTTQQILQLQIKNRHYKGAG
jgi:tRNA(Ile)-lysidine synthase